jgi:nucleoside-diphosphate-sugar epimerase
MRVLITGGAGILGAEIAHQCAERGDELLVVDRRSDDPRLDGLPEGIRIVSFDLSDAARLDRALATFQPQVIHHCAAVLGPEAERDPSASFASNIAAFHNLLEASVRHRVGRVVFASSTAVQGDMVGPIDESSPVRPQLMYGIEKLYGEQVCAWYRARRRLDVRSLRFAQIVAPNCRICWVWAPDMIENALAGRRHRSRFATRCHAATMLWIGDAARAARELADADTARLRLPCYLVSDGPRVTQAHELAAALIRRYPGFSVDWPDGSTPPRWSGIVDCAARGDWGWRPTVVGLPALIRTFEEAITTRPGRYGLRLPAAVRA